jgi:hypothetical protein
MWLVTTSNRFHLHHYWCDNFCTTNNIWCYIFS